MRWWDTPARTLPVGVLVAAIFCPASAGELVQWTDEKGVLHFSDSLASVPLKYRGQVKLEKLKEELPPKPAPPERTSLQRPKEPQAEKFKPNSYEVPFEAYEGTAQRVIVSVKFNDSVTARMLLDTGAPGLLIFTKLANKLGILSGDEGRVVVQSGGIGGSVPAIRTFIDKVQIGEAKDSFIPATVNLTPSVSPAFEGLIGMDFMSKYSFKIDSVRQVLIFEEIEPNPDWPAGRSERWWRDRFKELHELRAAWERFAPEEHRPMHYSAGSFAALQVAEVDKLIDKLDRYANQYFVPRHWR